MSHRLKKEYPYRIVASAVQGCQSPSAAKKYSRNSRLGAPCEPLINNLERYASENGGDLMLLAIQGAYATEIELDPFFRKRDDIYMNPFVYNRLKCQQRAEFEKMEETGDPSTHFWDMEQKNYHTAQELILNDKFSVILKSTPSQNRDPLSLAKDITRYFGRSVAFGSTKQRLIPVPKNLGEKSPRLMLTTGSCNLPNYNGSNDKGDRAFRDHTLGCAVIDVIDRTTYLARLAKSNTIGTLFDLGLKLVDGREPQKADVKALYAGDIHSPFHHRKAIDSTIEMANLFGVKEVITGDIIDFVTIAHHNWGDALHGIDLAKMGLTRLEDEVEVGYDLIKEIAERIAPATLVVTYGNHDDFVRKYITSGRHFQSGDAVLNGSFCTRVLERMGYANRHKTTINDFKTLRDSIITDVSPPSVVRACLEAICYPAKLPFNVKFLRLGEDHRIWGVQTGAHGHKGPRGARGNLRNSIGGFGKVVIGHTHQLEEKDGSVSVSTLCHHLEYERGQPSTLVRGNAAIYEGGLVQAIPIIGDDALWATEEHKKTLKDLGKVRKR